MWQRIALMIAMFGFLIVIVSPFTNMYSLTPAGMSLIMGIMLVLLSVAELNRQKGILGWGFLAAGILVLVVALIEFTS
ncbi:hypothetical protein [Halalkalibacillus halophilus]|uniref:hypothetical protein n=1 Tax=Halalkalibacillus halophilus TaxID=392827 RepID=UPI00048953A2|nr:hypothetical protein [Halalkalibacillus halophilus]